VKIAFGGAALLSPLTGIGHYAYQLGSGLQQQPGFQVDFFYGSGFSPQIRHSVPAVTGQIRVLVRKLVPNAYALRRALEQRRFDSGAARTKYDLYHEPNYLALRFDGPTVITVHDLSWIRYPETHPPERVRAMERYFEPALRRAARLLTDSEFVKREVIEVFGLDPDLIEAIPLGLDPLFSPRAPAQTQAVLRRLALVHGGYFLSVGTMEPRKNLQATVKAYASLPAAVRERHPLVIAGMKGWRTTAIERLLEPLVECGQARLLGYLAREDLAAVTAGALAMVYPSIYEGYGLPIVEAFHFGKAVLTSTGGALPEVAGDFSPCIAPTDEEAWYRTMKQWIEDPAVRAPFEEKIRTAFNPPTWNDAAASFFSHIETQRRRIR